MGLGLIAVLVAYLPTIYAACSRREAAHAALATGAGTPPSAVERLIRTHRIDRLGELDGLWLARQAWFADVEETHTSLAAVVFFCSPRSDRSWVTAAGAVLDSAALVNSTVDVPRSPQASLCVRSGYLCLRAIGDFFDVAYDPDPAPTDPISITRDEFDAACAPLADAGVPLEADRDQAWRDFRGLAGQLRHRATRVGGNHGGAVRACRPYPAGEGTGRSDCLVNRPLPGPVLPALPDVAPGRRCTARRGSVRHRRRRWPCVPS